MFPVRHNNHGNTLNTPAPSYHLTFPVRHHNHQHSTNTHQTTPSSQTLPPPTLTYIPYPSLLPFTHIHFNLNFQLSCQRHPVVSPSRKQTYPGHKASGLRGSGTVATFALGTILSVASLLSVLCLTSGCHNALPPSALSPGTGGTQFRSASLRVTSYHRRLNTKPASASYRRHTRRSSYMRPAPSRTGHHALSSPRLRGCLMG